MSTPRPIYESRENLHNEGRLLSVIESALNCKGAKLPVCYQLDFALHRNRVVHAFAELKCRTHAFGTYPTYILSAHKVAAAVDLSISTGAPAYLVVEWTNAIGFIEISAPQVSRIVMGGRKDRGDWQDTEPVAEFDVRKFKMLKTAMRAA